MTINPFVAGILITIGVELLAAVIFIIVQAHKYVQSQKGQK